MPRMPIDCLCIEAYYTYISNALKGGECVNVKVEYSIAYRALRHHCWPFGFLLKGSLQANSGPSEIDPVF